MLLKTKVMNAKGDKYIMLNEHEQRIVELNQKQMNALGFEVDITTMTAVQKKVLEQKFFEIPPADYLPVRVGEGAYSSQLLSFRSYNIADDFATGIIGSSGNNGRLAGADAGVDSISIKVNSWAKQIDWSHFQLQEASRTGVWDIVTAREKSRKINWDLGIQKVAFLGLTGDPSILGLYNQAGITANTTLITKAISTMTTTELKTFVVGVLGAYRTNCNRTAWPTHFVIPETDFLGLAAPSNADYPLKSTLAVLEETFQIMTKNAGFKILPNAYGDNTVSALGVQKYVLYNATEDSLRMDIPVDYQSTLASSLDNFHFQNVGYGQFTGVLAYRPSEMLYFQY